MFIQRLIFGAAFCWLCLGFVAPSFAAPPQKTEAAHVSAVTSGAFVMRGDVRTPLKLKDYVYATDRVSTDAKGKVQLAFTDGTIVDLAPDSMVSLSDFSFGGAEKPNFAMNLGKGLARIVSGKIVEQNPAGFNIDTPQATIGIRGTILTADVRNPEKTIVILTEIGEGHYVGVFNAVTKEDTHMTMVGTSCEITSSGNTMRPSTPAEAKIAKSVEP